MCFYYYTLLDRPDYRGRPSSFLVMTEKITSLRTKRGNLSNKVNIGPYNLFPRLVFFSKNISIPNIQCPISNIQSK